MVRPNHALVGEDKINEVFLMQRVTRHPCGREVIHAEVSPSLANRWNIQRRKLTADDYTRATVAINEVNPTVDCVDCVSAANTVLKHRLTVQRRTPCAARKPHLSGLFSEQVKQLVERENAPNVIWERLSLREVEGVDVGPVIQRRRHKVAVWLVVNKARIKKRHRLGGV